MCGTSFLEGTTDEEVEAEFVATRGAHYAEIARAADDAAGEADVARLAKRIADVAAVDWFHAPQRVVAERALRAAEERVRGTARELRAGGSAPSGATWVTRAGVFVDRIASAWLIRRFIDPDARFAFVAGTRHRPKAGEVRFDMSDAEFTHEGDRCTFEVLLDRFALRDAALDALAEIVHDIDLKDEKYGRAEASGVSAVLQGIAVTARDDAERIERGAALIDGLYASLGGAR